MNDLPLTRIFAMINLEEEFANTPHAVIVNNETMVAKKISESYTDAIYRNVDGELGFVPTCECGEIRGRSREGMWCHKCNTECSSQFINALSHSSWIGIPEFMPPVLHPVWYMILERWLKIGRRGISAIDIILDTEKDIPEELAPYLRGRGFRYFAENTDDVMDLLLHRFPKTAKKPKTKAIELLYEKYGDRILTTKLPILHNSLHPMKKSGSTLRFVDSSSKSILSAIINLSNESYRYHSTTVSERQLNKALYGIYKDVLEYYKSLIDNKLSAKNGLLRKHCCGSRLHFSMRTVVVPHDTILPMDIAVPPWRLAINCLKLHILNYLVHKKGYSVPDAVKLFFEAQAKYIDEIYEASMWAIRSYPGQKLPVIQGRNPTINLGSIQMLYWKDIKKDPADETLAINAGVAALPNTDFDGDENYSLPLFENDASKAFEATHPIHLLVVASQPGIGSSIGFLKQNSVCLYNYLNECPDIEYYEEVE